MAVEVFMTSPTQKSPKLGREKGTAIGKIRDLSENRYWKENLGHSSLDIYPETQDRGEIRRRLHGFVNVGKSVISNFLANATETILNEYFLLKVTFLQSIIQV
ncbi:hypothetical protein CDAR_245741 [Caerostris darwini]|uniref:Uncharacterized protein n=1 Tax=Caerostris darwini TaxID=1538125 RepID=A0AAV4S6N7_9ARAC|nr:hypothetical protein CDAR_245741 [Caerostris darwini]